MKGGSVHIDKATDENLRGVGKLDYTNRSRLNSTIKKMSAAMAGDEVKKTPGKKKYEHVCPGCGKKIKSNSKNIPKHKPNAHYGLLSDAQGFCNQGKRGITPPKRVDVVESVYINGYLIKKGDTVAFTTYPWKYDFVDPNELKSYVVKELHKMEGGNVCFEFEGIDQDVPTYIFVKNLIKL